MPGTLRSLTLDVISFTLVVEHDRPKRSETIRVHADEQQGVFSLHELRRTACDGKVQFVPMKTIPLACRTWNGACYALATYMQTLLDEVDYYQDTLFDVLQERYRKKVETV